MFFAAAQVEEFSQDTNLHIELTFVHRFALPEIEVIR